MDSLKKVPKAAWAGAGVLVLLIVVGVVVLAGGSSSSEDLTLNGSAYPGVDTSNTRHAKSAIDTSSVSNLEVAWSMPLTAKSSFGAYAASPVIVNGVIYSQDLESNVQAISLESGQASRNKRVRITGLTIPAVQAQITAAIAGANKRET